MMKRISPATHGIADYGFALLSLTVPTLLGASKKTKHLYAMIALEVFLYGALTKHKYALKGLISLDAHKKIDLSNLIGIALLSGSKRVKEDKRVLAFNLALLAIGVANVLATDWNDKPVVSEA